MANTKSSGIVIAEVRVFSDHTYEFTGRTAVCNAQLEDLNEVVDFAKQSWGDDFTGLQVMGYANFLFANTFF